MVSHKDARTTHDRNEGTLANARRHYGDAAIANQTKG
jgi:hypothetical protein